MIDATALLRIYSSFRRSQLAALNPAACQESSLLKLLRKAAGTRFGKEHSFSSIKNVLEFQSRVPLRSYEDFWRDYWEASFPVIDNATWPGRLKFFAVSSGTSSGTTKYLPYNEYTSRGYSQAGLDLLVHHLAMKPKSKIFSGRNFALGGSTELVEEAPGVFSGDISGISVKELPFWAKPFFFPPKELALEKDWEKKIDLFAKESLKVNITMLGGVPSWTLIFIDKLRELHDKPQGKLVDFYPNLEMLVHGGVNFAPYYKEFTELLEGSHAELREVYPASEGFFAVADRGYGEGLRLMLDTGIFYEFIPVEELGSETPTRHWVGNIERDLNYAVAISTGAGLFAYLMGDTVKFVDTKPPRLLITGRTSYMMSAFGEHLIGEEVEDALSSAAEEIKLEVRDYCMGALYPSAAEKLGGHLYFVEFKDREPSPSELEAFIQKLDSRLCERNEDYEAHRAEGFGLRGPEVIAVSEGFFRSWMEKRGKLGGQNKVPRIINDQELFQTVRDHASSPN